MYKIRSKKAEIFVTFSSPEHSKHSINIWNAQNKQIRFVTKHYPINHIKWSLTTQTNVFSASHSTNPLLKYTEPYNVIRHCKHYCLSIIKHRDLKILFMIHDRTVSSKNKKLSLWVKRRQMPTVLHNAVTILCINKIAFHTAFLIWSSTIPWGLCKTNNDMGVAG